MNPKIFIWSFSLVFALSSQAQERYIKIVEKSIEKRTQYGSIAYDMELSYKMFHMSDTLVHNGRVEMIRKPEDEIYSGLFSIDLDSIWYGYNGEHIMSGSSKDSTLIFGDPQLHPGLFVQSTWVNNFLDYGFLKLPPGPSAYINNPSIGKVYADTVIEGRPCIGILFSLPDEEGFYKQRFFVAIDTIEYMVRNRMYSTFFQENEQYTNWLYKEVTYGNDQHIEKLDDGFIKSAFPYIEPYYSDTAYEEIPKEYDYTLLEGKPYNKDEIFRLKDTKANLIILDFWYTSCYPCIKGIPSVNRLARDYKEKGVKVFGVNMIDDEVKSKARLEKFFKNNLMEYQPIMVNPALAADIGIRSYPTLIVLDRNYKIIYIEDGFMEDLYEQVSKVLDANL